MSPEYRKDFDNWNESKKIIHEQSPNIGCSEGDIWWCSLGVNIGVEEDGKQDIFERPVLIVKKINARCSWVVPLSSSIQNNYYRHNLSGAMTQVVLSQIRTIDNKRLQRRISVVTSDELSIIIEKLRAILFYKFQNPLM